MNFFKSILVDDPEPAKSGNSHDSDSDSPDERHHDEINRDDAVHDDGVGAWSFGGLIKTIQTRSESVIETYRKDLQEFGSGLKKETEIVREVASRAVKDLPTSLEAGASAAQGALDGVLKSTAEIISKETLFFASDGEPETPDTNRNLNSARYSWFQSQLSVIQGDQSTFCDNPEDVEEYKKWRLEFNLEEKSDEIEDLIGENGPMEGVYIQVVPSTVDDETFWYRYFYRVEKLKQQEKVRANLVKRAISADEDEELSWDVDDEDEEGSRDEQASDVKVKGGNEVGDKGVSGESLNSFQKQEDSSSGSNEEKEGVDNNSAVEKSSEKVGEDSSLGTKEVKFEEVVHVKSDEKVKSEEIASEDSSKKSNEGVSLGTKEVKTGEVAQVQNDEKVKFEGSVENKNDEKVAEEKGTRSDATVVTSDQSKVDEEEDMGWDEIENIGSDDEKKVSAGTGSGSPNRAELRKRLSAADDDEDLSWDIEDDDEPIKA